ncbi:MAG: T9SS type A sorting domain-containing protein, partial [Ignavibacteria bacterium]|nr:T9SS type A sorting domain-containing protein [Ignavibacteria bacterium]
IVGVTPVGTTIPDAYGLSQNYPNPFNPVTNFTFSIPANASVTLKVYDITGRLIESLLENEMKSPGFYTVSFNASKYSSGIYFYTLTADNFTSTKKMILAK